MLSLQQEDVLASAVATAVLEGLTAYPKHLPPWLLYDAQGSAIFEEITELPEYYLTRVERWILENNATDIVERVGGEISVIELGAGTASKTGILIRAILRRQPHAIFYPIDVSASALETAVRRLNGSFPALSVRPVVADYSSGLAQLAAAPGRKLVLYIGSSIGNYEPEEASALLRNVRQKTRAWKFIWKVPERKWYSLRRSGSRFHFARVNASIPRTATNTPEKWWKKF